MQRAEELLERFIVPYAQSVLQQDSFGHTLRSRRAQAVLDKYRAQLKPIFDFYAAADTTSAEARESSASLNLAEVLLLTTTPTPTPTPTTATTTPTTTTTTTSNC